MIYKISIALLFPLLIISFALSLAGVTSVSGDSYYMFLKDVSVRFNSWSFSIPNIPQVRELSSNGIDNSGGILEVLRAIANFFVFLLNAIISMVNILVTIVNVLIHILQFIISIVWSIKDFVDKQLVANLFVSSWGGA